MSARRPARSRGAALVLSATLLHAAPGCSRGTGDAPVGSAGAPAAATESPPVAAPSAPLPEAAACPPDHLPDDGVCLPLPPSEASEPESPARIELLPGRSEDYARYLTPIAAYPATAPRQGLGVFIPAPRGTPVMALELEAQTGPTRVIVTAAAPHRLLSLHRVERGGSLRSYVIAYEGLDFEPTPGARDVDVGTPLGRVSSGSSTTGLALGARQLRRDVDPGAVAPERLLLDATSIACDARNVLPLKPAR